jgi:ribosomal protein S27E
MPSTVQCPDCHRPATVLGRFTTGGADNPSEFLRIRCAGLLTLLVPATEATAPPADRAG